MKKTSDSGKSQSDAHAHDVIDEASKESFPTSDPPAWTLGTDQEREQALLTDKITIATILAREHQVIRALIEVMNKVIHRLERQKPVAESIYHSLHKVLHIFVDQCHHPKEELLFPTMRSGENHPTDYMLADLRQEHEASDALHADLLTVSHDREKLIELLKNLVSLHSNHIAKEEEYILPKINALVRESEQAIFLQSFTKIDQQHGKDNLKEMLKLIEEMNNQLHH